MMNPVETFFFFFIKAKRELKGNTTPNCINSLFQKVKDKSKHNTSLMINNLYSGVVHLKSCIIAHFHLPCPVLCPQSGV